MDNEKCVLVRFSNNKKAAVGYLDWLEKYDQVMIEEIIKDRTEITIFWPDCEAVSSIKTMNNSLKKAKYSKYAATVLEQGPWVTVRDAQKSYNKAGVSSTSRSSRKDLKRNKDLEDDYITDKSKAPHKKSKTSTSQSTSQSKKDAQSALIKKLGFGDDQSDDTHSVKSGGVASNTNQVNSISDSKKNDKSAKEINNKHQNDENIVIDEEMHDISESTAKKSKTYNVSDSDSDIERKENSNQDTHVGKSGIDISQFQDPLVRDCFSKMMQEINDLKQKKNHSKDSTASVTEPKPSGSKNATSQQEKTVKLGDSEILVSRRGLKHCSTQSVTSFTTDLLSLVFTDEVLGTSSKTGKPSSFNKNKPAKPALDPEIIDAVESHVLNHFGDTKDHRTLITNSIRNKCTNAASALKRAKARTRVAAAAAAQHQ